MKGGVYRILTYEGVYRILTLLYCMADFIQHKLLVSGEPFPVRTYRVKDGIRHPAGQCEELSKKRKRTGQKPSGRKL